MKNLRTTALLLLLPLRVFGLDNAFRYTDRTGFTQTLRPFTASRVFVQDEICDFPQPFIGETGITPWQSDNVNRWPASALCPSGSVKRADISFRATVPANGTLTVNFRNNVNACSSGNRAACDAAALDQAGMLAFNGGTWGLQAVATANPQGSTSARTTNFRTAMASGLWRYGGGLRGPVATRVVVEDASTNLTTDFGWKENGPVRITGTLGTTNTDIPVENVTDFTGLSKPFTIEIDGEHIQICFVGASSLTVGITNGTSSACADVAGRGANGTTSASHSQGIYANFLHLGTGIWITSAVSSGATSISVNDGSSINAATLIQLGHETIRICNRSGNTLTVGTASWSCAASDRGRSYHGTSPAFQFGNSWPTGTMIRTLTGLSNRWIDAPQDRYKSIHPEAILTFYAGWSGVGQVVIFNNYWTTKFQDQIFDLTITNSGGTLASWIGLKMVPRTRKRMPLWNVADSQYWDGSAPGEVRIDYNAAYLHAAGVVPLDPDIVLSTQGVTEELSQSTATSGPLEPGWDEARNNRCEETLTTLVDTTSDVLYTFGSHIKQLDNSGAKRGVGLIYGIDARAMASWKSNATNAHRINEVALSMGACAGNMPLHYRESATGQSYCAGGAYTANPSDTSCTGSNLSTPAFGYPLSLDARPTSVPNNQVNTLTADQFRPVGYSTGNHFGTGNGTYQHWTGHMPPLGWLPYVMTGDEFLRQELVFRAHMTVASASEFPDYSVTSNPGERFKQRHRSWGWLYTSNGSRTRAWSVRDLSWGAWAAFDGSPEKQYLTSKLNRNIAIDEGRFEITDGQFYSPCPTPSAPNDDSPWCAGRYKSNNASLTAVYSLELPMNTYCEPASVDCTRTFYNSSPWMDGYLQLAMKHSEDIGFTQWRAARTRMFKGLVDRLTRSDYSMFLAGYREPAMPCIPEGTPQVGGCAGQTYTSGSQIAFSSFTHLYDAHLASSRAVAAHTTDSDYFGGVAQIVFGASAMLGEIQGSQATGLRAWERMRATVRHQNYATLPQWAMRPRERVTMTARAGDTAIYLSGSTTTATAPCRVAIATTFPANSDDSGDDVAVMAGREWSFVATGLTASTSYAIRVTCGTGRAFTSLSTTAPSGANTTATITTRIPGANNIEVAYGAGFASSVSGSCPSGVCSASIPALTGRALEYRYRGRDAGNVVITGWSSTYRIIP